MTKQKVVYSSGPIRAKFKRCKKLYDSYKVASDKAAEYRTEIADIAIELSSLGVTTVKLAEVMGCGYTSLLNWVTDRENELSITTYVEQKTKSKKGKVQGINEGINRAALKKTLRGLNKKSTPAQAVKAYRKNVSRSPEDRSLDAIVKQLANIKFQICDSFDLTKLDQDKLGEAHQLLLELDTYVSVYFDVPMIRTAKVLPIRPHRH